MVYTKCPEQGFKETQPSKFIRSWFNRVEISPFIYQTDTVAPPFYLLAAPHPPMGTEAKSGSLDVANPNVDRRESIKNQL